MNWNSNLFLALSAAVCMPAAMPAQGSKDAIRQMLETRYVASSARQLVLKTDNLMMTDLASGVSYPNLYQDGKLTQSAEAMTRYKGIAGDSLNLWLSNIDVKDSGLVLEVFGETRYKATVEFPFPKGKIPPTAEVERMVGEVFATPLPPRRQARSGYPGAS